MARYRLYVSAYTVTPGAITIDKNAAYPKALKEFKEDGIFPNLCTLQRIKRLNNLVDASTIVPSNGWSILVGFFSFATVFDREKVHELLIA